MITYKSDCNIAVGNRFERRGNGYIRTVVSAHRVERDHHARS
jgi:hypothetical protein